MTREEEVKVSALKYLDDFNPDVCGICNEDIYDAFIAGTLYADQHPDLSSLWHDASDEPVKDTDILIETSFFEDDLDYYSCHWSTSICPSWEEYVKEYNIKRWAYLGDLVDV